MLLESKTCRMRYGGRCSRWNHRTGAKRLSSGYFCSLRDARTVYPMNCFKPKRPDVKLVRLSTRTRHVPTCMSSRTFLYMRKQCARRSVPAAVIAPSSLGKISPERASCIQRLDLPRLVEHCRDTLNTLDCRVELFSRTSAKRL